MTLKGLFDFVLVLVMAIYLMVDGPQAFKWIMAFFPMKQRAKISAAMPEISRLTYAYMVGQFITSALCALFVFGVLTILRVPMASLLGFVAGLFDILPIIGFFLSVLPSMAIGLTKGPGTALIIPASYGIYHLFENYFIIPKVYGKKLQLSNLAVLIAILAAGLAAGIVGAIAILPLIAAYPVVERHWLAHRFEPDTLQKHEQMNSQS